MTFAGLILAAGASSRMGYPKALLRLNGETILERLFGTLDSVCDNTWVVLGHDADRIRTGLRRPQAARWVLNPEPERGQLSSLLCGLRAIGNLADAVMFTPVDYPLVGRPTVQALRRAVEQASVRPLLALPRYRGRRGHPVCIDVRLIPSFFRLPPEGAARDVIRAHTSEALYVDVDDPGILRDVDTPEDYRAVQNEVSVRIP